MNDQRLARGLGWFSIALGTAEVLAPGMLARALGLEDKEGLIRTYGLREIATGVAILSASDPTAGVWARVGVDALVLASVTQAFDADNPKKANVGIALIAVAGVTALDVLCGQQLGGSHVALVPRDYSDRSGFSRGPEAMRGAAAGFEPPADMRTPELLRPYTGTALAH
jgi:hypothetical protein